MSHSTKQQGPMLIVVRLPPKSAYGDSKMAKTGFLKLPPEIRNMIYACLSTSIAQSRSQDSRGGIRISSRPNNSPYITPTDWRVSARPDIGLVQSCRQIRSEYLPIHVAHTQLDMTLSSLVTYARTIESARHVNCTEHFTLPLGTATLIFQNESADWVPDPSNPPLLHFPNYNQALDILPLLRTYARFPDAHLTIHPSAAYLAALFHLHGEPVWRATLLGDLHAVRLFHDYSGKINVQIRVTQKCARPWMRRCWGGWLPASGELVEWLEGVGLGGLVRVRGWGPLRVAVESESSC